VLTIHWENQLDRNSTPIHLPIFPKMQVLFSPFSDSYKETTASLPTLLEIFVVACVAALVTAIDLYISAQNGLLTMPPFYDGVVYLVEAKRIFYALKQSFNHGLHLLLSSRTPLWTGLIVLGLGLFGEGEWQCYLTRFWIAFGLLLLIVWLVRRRAGSTIAWIALALTALLPTVSVSLRASSADIAHGTEFIFWYLADPRPDPLFSILLLWAIAILVENAPTLSRAVLLTSSTFIALAVLCKSSTLIAMLLVWGLAIVFIYGFSSAQTRFPLQRLTWTIIPLGMVFLVWSVGGGFKVAIDYIYHVMVVDPSRWTDPKQTLLGKLSFQGAMSLYHLGVEGLFILSIGVISFIVLWVKKWLDARVLIYAILCLVYYGLASLNPVGLGNYFFGLPYILLCWVFAWTSLTPLLAWFSRSNKQQIGLLTITGFYCVFTLWQGFASSNQLLEIGRMAIGQKNRQTYQEAGKILEKARGAQCFILPAGNTFIHTHLYYAVSRTGETPNPVIFPNPGEKFSSANIEAANCSFVVTFDGSAEALGNSSVCASPIPECVAAITEIKKWVETNSQYARVGKYPFEFSGKYEYEYPISWPWLASFPNQTAPSEILMQIYAKR
jgi:hypothetical protein